MDKKTKTSTQKEAYKRPTIHSQKVIERAALSCSNSPFLNSQTDTKDNSTICGYSDS